MSVLFSKAKIAAACAGIVFMLSYVPYMYIAILESLGPAQPFGVKCFVVSEETWNLKDTF